MAVRLGWDAPPRRPLPPGKLSRRTGKREQAQEHFSTATAMYREMGMMYWLEKGKRSYNFSLESSDAIG
jgi:hypothetical protein